MALRRRTPPTQDQAYEPGTFTPPTTPQGAPQYYQPPVTPPQRQTTTERTLPYSPPVTTPQIPDGATADGRGGWSRNTVLPEDQRTPYRGPRGNRRTPPPYAPPVTAPVTPQEPTGPAPNTNGYDAPEYIPEGSAGAPAGWDTEKWANAAHQTPKYGVGRILAQYPPTTAGLAQAWPDIQRAYPGATFDGKDKIMIPGVGTIDVLVGASQGGSAWQWDDLTEQGLASAAPASTRTSTPATTPRTATERPTTRNAIMEQLDERPLRTARYRQV